MNTDASPLGTHCSAYTRQPVPVPMMTPNNAVPVRAPWERCAFEKYATTSRMNPEMV